MAQDTYGDGVIGAIFAFITDKTIPIWVKILVPIVIIFLIVKGSGLLISASKSVELESKMAMAAAATVLVTKGGRKRRI